MQGAVGERGVAGPRRTGTGGRRSRGTAGTGCCSRTALLGTPLLSSDHCRDPAQVRSMGKTGSDCEKLNFDLIENGVRLDLVDDEYTVVYRSKAIY